MVATHEAGIALIIRAKQADTTRPQKITLGEMREMGVRGLLLYCSDFSCSHSAEISAKRGPDKEGLLQRFRHDQSGSYIIIALAMPVLVGAAGLGTEVGWWLYEHKNMQSAADSVAVSAATAGSNLSVEANSVTSFYGLTNGTKNVAVTVNQ